MPTIKLFLASSAALKADREQFEIFINRRNKRWQDRGVFFELVIWEDFIDALAPTRLQDEYNKAIRVCDIFIMLFATKVGKYTEEEFETAFGQFQATRKPLIYTYFKDVDIKISQVTQKDLNSLWAFQKKLKRLGHFQTTYKTPEGLCQHFTNQLEKLADEGVIPTGRAEKPTGPIPRHLTRPPFIPELFWGRDADLAAVHNSLFAENHLLLLVNGEGGIGKTTLAAQYFCTYEKKYRHLAWIFAEASLLNALLSLALPLGLDFPETLPGPDRLERLLARMAELPGPGLLVLDNANNLADLQQHYQALRVCPNFHILLTTRITEFAHAARHRVGALAPDAALALFRSHYPQHRSEDNPLLGRILAAVGYNTLVIELLAKNLHHRNRLKSQYTLADLLRDLQNQGLLAIKGRPVTTAYHATGLALRQESPEAIVAAMYDLGELSPAETALLSVFAVLPAENIAYASLETLLGAAAELEPTVLTLSQRGWIDYDEARASFKISPVVQEITREKNRERLRPDCQQLIDSLMEKLRYQPGTGHLLNSSYAEAALWTRYGASVVQHRTEADHDLAILCERLGNYHNTTGNLDQALRYFDQYHQLKQQLYNAYPDHVDFKNGLAISYWNLGDFYRKKADKNKAISYFKAAERLWAELVKASPGFSQFQQYLQRVRKDLEDL